MANIATNIIRTLYQYSERFGVAESLATGGVAPMSAYAIPLKQPLLDLDTHQEAATILIELKVCGFFVSILNLATNTPVSGNT